MKYYKYEGNYVATHSKELVKVILENNEVIVESLEDIIEITKEEAFGVFSYSQIKKSVPISSIGIDFTGIRNEIFKMKKWESED